MHTFHIPVMGIGFSVDTPAKVAKYGISSVISLVNDSLIEEMRKYYCGVVGHKYVPITEKEDDCRARRITAYLNLLDEIVNNEFEKVRSSEFNPGSEITKYFNLLPESSSLKKQYNEMLNLKDSEEKERLQAFLRKQMFVGSIDVNIMTKLDRTNYGKDNNPLSDEFSDALSALRGYAKSTLNSAIVFSAGINRKLYTYVEKFEDFYANASGFIKKKIILKVSDYRSSIIQGKFFAKKGLWISEYRVESGLNCGGHAFASDGFLLGPILEEFKNKKDELIASLSTIYNKALKLKNKQSSDTAPDVTITAQGGIGTAKEDNFLLSHYKVTKTGWGTPFLLVPEVTNVDSETLQKLATAKEDDLYSSNISPLGVLFNNLKNSISELAKIERVEKGIPGSLCQNGHLVTDTEFTERPICPASRQYQKLKLEQLACLKLKPSVFKKNFDKIIAKACICRDLSASALIKCGFNKDKAKLTTAVCPGPNLAYFSKISSLKEMVDHIYGRINLLNSTQRQNMFIKELKMYVESFIQEATKCLCEPTDKKIKRLVEFKNNLLEGIEYYFELFPKMIEETKEYHERALAELQIFKTKLENFVTENSSIFMQPATNPIN